MRLRDIFNVPDGEKVTDKAFARVLISSVCGILLCMGCLAGTTWAWFIAGTENPDNVIAIASVTADVTVRQNDVAIAADVNNTYLLTTGTYDVTVQVTNTATHSTRPAYVLMTVTQDAEDTLYYLPFENGNNAAHFTLEITDPSAVIGFTTRWAQPAALPVPDGALTIGDPLTETE